MLSFFLLLLLSYDSYLMHVCAFRCDSAWFFTCGKAWMEGMTPYVDFVDSKGILLWLIYGIGYLISPISYIGIFWLSVIAYSVTFNFIWKTARLFLNRGQSLLALAIMPFFLFLHMFHNEVRAEDFCYPAVCAGIYYTLLVFRNSSRNVIRRCAFWLGIAMMWCLLIKWSIFVIMGGMALTIAGTSANKKSADGVIFGLLGMIAMALPFLVYFLIEGNFAAFIQEYFITTFQITGGAPLCNLQKFNIALGILIFVSLFWLTRKYKTDSTKPAVLTLASFVIIFGIYIVIHDNIGNYVLEQLTVSSAKQGAQHWVISLANILRTLQGVILNIALIAINFSILGVCILLFCKRFYISSWMLFSFLPFYCFFQLEALYPYYCTIVSPFYIFFVIYAISVFSNSKVEHSLSLYISTSIVLFFCGILFNLPWERLIFIDNKAAKNVEAGMTIIAKKPYARIVFIGMDYGEGLFAKALPGCKYWARQNGTTNEMIADRNDAIRLRKADFVVINKYAILSNTYKLLKDSGYKPCYKFLYPKENGRKTIIAWLYTK